VRQRFVSACTNLYRVWRERECVCVGTSVILPAFKVAFDAHCDRDNPGTLRCDYYYCDFYYSCWCVETTTLTTMQFSYNEDYPRDEQRAQLDARDPLSFPPAQPLPCTRITTRVYHPKSQTMTTVQNVLVRTAAPPLSSRRHSSISHTNRRFSHSDAGSVIDPSNSSRNDAMEQVDDVMFSSSSDSDFSDSDDETNKMETTLEPPPNAIPTAPTVPATTTAQPPPLTSESETVTNNLFEEEECAYWIQRTVREAIYGRVLMAIVLRKRRKASLPALNSSGATTTMNVHDFVWEVTPYHCAVKEMSWQHIRKERHRLAENPIQEVNAMQYIARYCNSTLQAATSSRSNQTMYPDRPISVGSGGVPSAIPASNATTTSKIDEAFANMVATNVMMPLDILSDEHYLYSIMPYCNGGELFEWLDMNEKFTENQARYWMNQIFNVRITETPYHSCGVTSFKSVYMCVEHTRHGHENRVGKRAGRISVCFRRLHIGPRMFAARWYLPSRHEFGEFTSARIRCTHY
jgi:hypothetical protein